MISEAEEVTEQMDRLNANLDQLQEELAEDRQRLKCFLSGLARLAQLRELNQHTTRREEAIEA